MDADLLSRINTLKDQEHRPRAQMARVLIIEAIEARDARSRK